MRKNSDQIRHARRGFLKAALAGIAGLGAFHEAKASIKDSYDADIQEQPAEKEQGYQETEHVRTYYHTARF